MTLETVKQESNILFINADGRLTKDDYENIFSDFNKVLNEHDKVRVVIDACDFDGWEGSALWEDLKFDIQHYSSAEKIAVIGDHKWKEIFTKMFKPFNKAEIKYFDVFEKDQAEKWIRE